jgi:ABC-2 type transport system ATP-binding protein
MLHVRLQSVEQRKLADEHLTRVLGVEIRAHADPDLLVVQMPDASRVGDALAALSSAGVAVTEVSLGQPSLDEVFFALTGRPAEAENAGGNGYGKQEVPA